MICSAKKYNNHPGCVFSVSQVQLDAVFEVKDTSEDDLYLDHDLFVTPGQPVTFELLHGDQVS